METGVQRLPARITALCALADAPKRKALRHIRRAFLRALKALSPEKEEEPTISERLLLLPLDSLLLSWCLLLSLTLFRRLRLLLRHTFLLLALPSPLQAAKPQPRPTTTVFISILQPWLLSRVECYFGKNFLKISRRASRTFRSLKLCSWSLPRCDSRLFYMHPFTIVQRPAKSLVMPH